MNKVLLIDDNRADNFLHKIVIEKSGFAKTIVAHQSAESALIYISTKEKNNEYPNPELILLDINMPGMDGWDFVAEYEKLSGDITSKIKVVMLTTSLNPDDKERAENKPLIAGFQNKPLTKESLEELTKRLSLI
jgi:CheY-like chemotaxis protein